MGHCAVFVHDRRGSCPSGGDIASTTPKSHDRIPTAFSADRAAGTRHDNGSLAIRGVLFFDELPELEPKVLEVLR